MELAFSVIIPTYNRKDLLKLVLTGLSVQTYKNFEVIIVDDGSNDGTAQMVEGFYRNYPIIYKYIEKVPGTGAARARNVGIDSASGEILVFIDSDSLIKSNFLEEHYRFHSKHVNLAVVSVRWHLKAQEILESKIKEGISSEDLLLDKLENQNKQFFFFSQNLKQFLVPWWFFSTSNASVRRSEVLKIGKFDEGFGQYILYEDTELAYRLHSSGTEFVFNRNAECFHLYHPIDEITKLEHSKGNIKYFQKKYPDKVEIQLLDLIVNNDLKKNRGEELGWIRYLNELSKTTQSKKRYSKHQYIVPVKNQWIGLQKFINSLDGDEDDINSRILVIDMGSDDDTDLNVQLLNTKHKIDYHYLDGVTWEMAIAHGKKYIFNGDFTPVRLTN